MWRIKGGMILRKFYFPIILLLACMLVFPAKMAFASSSDEAMIVDFPVTLNGILMNNVNSDYPILTYKDITYFPLTWNMCRFMGLTSEWDQEKGLSISKSDQTYGYQPDENTINNMSEVCTVTVPEYKITINGETIDNNEQQWPLLNFRGVTYFPLTWHYAVDEFGWNYSWSSQKGLTVSNPSGKTDSEYTILSLLNGLTFGKGYSFKASYYDHQTGKTTDYEGTVQNNYKGNDFISLVQFSTPDDYHNYKVTGGGNTYIGSNPQNSGFSIDIPGDINLQLLESDINNLPVVKISEMLLNLHFTGSDIQKIVDFDMVKSENGVTTWDIQTRDEKIEVDINSDDAIVGITITDGQISYNIKINNT